VLRFEDFWPLLQPFSNVSCASIFTKKYRSLSASPVASLYMLSLVFPNSSASSTLILIALQQFQPNAIFNLKKFLRYLCLCTFFVAFYLSHLYSFTNELKLTHSEELFLGFCGVQLGFFPFFLTPEISLKVVEVTLKWHKSDRKRQRSYNQNNKMCQQNPSEFHSYRAVAVLDTSSVTSCDFFVTSTQRFFYRDTYRFENTRALKNLVFCRILSAGPKCKQSTTTVNTDWIYIYWLIAW